ncbi:MAG: hypothetical protein OHK0024_20430 [Thalassobaculales bacterium]
MFQEEDDGATGWIDFFMRQPEITEAERMGAVPADELVSFRLAMTEAGMLVKLKRSAGPPVLLRVPPEVAFYLHEYLGAALREPGVIDD